MKLRNLPCTFDKVTLLVTLYNETQSLQRTLDIIQSTTDPRDIQEILLIVCEKTQAKSLAAAQPYIDRSEGKIRFLYQTLPFLGGALQDGFKNTQGSHVIIMASDLETDPALVPIFIQKAKENPSSIITASRWAKAGGFKGYPPVKLILNRIFQKSFATLYGVKLTDITFGYRIFPTPVVHEIVWEELGHSFVLETLVKPLRLGVHVIEIPAQWRPRMEGQSQNTFFGNYCYLKTGLRILRANPAQFLKSSILSF